MNYRFKQIKLALNNPNYITRILKNKLRSVSKIDYTYLEGKSFLPNTVVLIPTYRCNLRCSMCFIYKGGKSHISNRKELDFKSWQKIIDDMTSFNPHFYIIGGEPLIYKNTLDIIKYVKDKGCYCSVNTNGILLTQYSEKLLQTGIDKITVSVDGPEEIYNIIRGNHFNEMMDGLISLVRNKTILKRFKPLIGINCVISSCNYKYLEKVVEIGKETGVDFVNFQHLQFSDEVRINQHNNLFKKSFGIDTKEMNGFLDETVTEIDTDYLTKIIDKMKKYKNCLHIEITPAIGDVDKYYNDLNFKFNNNYCIAPWTVTRVLPNGDVCVCFGHPDYVIGNLKKDSFTNIWNNNQYIDFRQKLKKHGLFPSCVRCCRREY